MPERFVELWNSPQFSELDVGVHPHFEDLDGSVDCDDAEDSSTFSYDRIKHCI